MQADVCPVPAADVPAPPIGRVHHEHDLVRILPDTGFPLGLHAHLDALAKLVALVQLCIGQASGDCRVRLCQLPKLGCIHARWRPCAVKQPDRMCHCSHFGQCLAPPTK
eukprot:13166140-Alexandrium_andersonii.AAC.1